MSWFPVTLPPYSDALPLLPAAVVCPVPSFDQCHAYPQTTPDSIGPHVTCSDFMSDQRICGITQANGSVATAHYVLAPTLSKETLDHVVYIQL
jgi:hypothetical protein